MLSFPKTCATCGAKWFFNHKCRPADLLDTCGSSMRCPRCGMGVSLTGINEPYCAYVDCRWNNPEDPSDEDQRIHDEDCQQQYRDYNS